MKKYLTKHISSIVSGLLSLTFLVGVLVALWGIHYWSVPAAYVIGGVILSVISYLISEALN